MTHPTAPTHQRDGLRLGGVAALEALGDGDSRLAVEILLAAIEADGIYVVRARCRFCRDSFEWAGLRDAHEFALHVVDEETVRLAAAKAAA